MKLDSTITISIILAICALFAPSITAIINNRHQYKIRKLELRHNFITNQSNVIYANKYNVYKSFLEEASKYSMFNDYAKEFTSILACTQDALLLCNPETKKLLLDFLERFSNHTISNRDEYITELNKIADSFNSELSSLSCE